jgi:hypothetical protein
MDAAGHDDGVVVDVVFEDGVLHLELVNLADRPALSVSCTFDAPVIDLEGRDVSQLRLFRHVDFLGPRRAVRTLLDSAAGYFERKTPTRFAVVVAYERPGEPQRETKVTHDLELYRELAYRTG